MADVPFLFLRRSSLDAVQQDPCKQLRHLLVGSARSRSAENLGYEAILVGYSTEPDHDGVRIAVGEGPFPLPARDILHKPFKDRSKLLLHPNEPLLVTFEGCEQDDAIDQGIAAIRGQDSPDECAEDSLIIISFHELAYFPDPLLFIRSLQMKLEYSAVECFFGRKMLKYNGFCHSGGGRDLFGRRAFESSAGECV